MSDRGAIPDEVWRRVRAGESLSAAWEGVKLREGAKAQSERVRTLERELAGDQAGKAQPGQEHRQYHRRRRGGRARPCRAGLERGVSAIAARAQEKWF